VPTELTIGETLEAARLAWSPKVDRADVQPARELTRFTTADGVRCGGLDTLERRKLLLTCVLMRKPSVILLDEPCSGLMQDEIDEMDVIIRQMAAETGMAVIVVEHRLELLRAVRAVLVMDAGEVIAEGRRASSSTTRSSARPTSGAQGRVTRSQVRDYRPVTGLCACCTRSISRWPWASASGSSAQQAREDDALRSIMGLVDWRRGEIELDGSRSCGRRRTSWRGRGGHDPSGGALFPGLSVRDNLDSGAFAAGWRERKKRRDRVLRLFRASPTVSGRSPLSGGSGAVCSLGEADVGRRVF
jgi:ABC-type branched-subunit amino acid transport system ATPase component